MRVSIVIPVLNTALAPYTIAHLKRQTRPPDEVIVVGLDRLNRIDRHDPFITFIDTEVRLLSQAARNLGATRVRGDILCFLDGDVLPEPGWLASIVACHQRGETVVAGGVLVPRNGYWPQCANLVGFLPFLADLPSGERSYLPTMNLSIRQQLFYDLGGFDEEVPHWGQDSDLSFRLRQRGHRLWLETRPGVWHCPSHHSLHDVWRAQRLYGAGYASLGRRYRSLIGGVGWRGLICRNLPMLAWPGSLALALMDIAPALKRRALRQFWYALPGMLLARLGWYAGMITGYSMADELSLATPEPARRHV